MGRAWLDKDRHTDTVDLSWLLTLLPLAPVPMRPGGLSMRWEPAAASRSRAFPVVLVAKLAVEIQLTPLLGSLVLVATAAASPPEPVLC